MKQDKIESLLSALLAGERRTASEICHSHYQQEKSILSVYEDLMMPSLYKIGVLWETNQISVAAEHLATAIIEAILNEFYSLIKPTYFLHKSVLAACVDGEYHQVGIKMVADTFEMNGWESHFLGANIPTNEILRYAAETKPKVIALSLSIYFHFPNLIRMIEEIQHQFPQTSILVGGQGLKHVPAHFFDANQRVHYLHSLREIKNYINILTNEPRTITDFSS